MARNDTCSYMATMLLLMLVLVALGCNATESEPQLIGDIHSSLSVLWPDLKLANATVPNGQWRLTPQDMASRSEYPMSVQQPIQSWEVDIYNLEGKLVLRAEVGLFETASADSVVRIFAASDPRDDHLEVASLHVASCRNPSAGVLQHPLLLFPSYPMSFQVGIYDPSGERMLNVVTESWGDVSLRIGERLESGMYLWRASGMTGGELVTTGLHVVRVVR